MASISDGLLNLVDRHVLTPIVEFSIGRPIGVTVNNQEAYTGMHQDFKDAINYFVTSYNSHPPVQAPDTGISAARSCNRFSSSHGEFSYTHYQRPSENDQPKIDKLSGNIEEADHAVAFIVRDVQSKTGNADGIRIIDGSTTSVFVPESALESVPELQALNTVVKAMLKSAQDSCQ